MSALRNTVQLYQGDEQGRPLGQRTGLGAVALADDQIALPVTSDFAVLRSLRSLKDGREKQTMPENKQQRKHFSPSR